MNPYTKLLCLLDALPQEGKIFLSNYRWLNDPKDALWPSANGPSRPCGCLFGTVCEEYRYVYLGRYFSGAREGVPIKWLEDIGLPEEEAADLESLNDNYCAEHNNIAICENRFSYMRTIILRKSREYSWLMDKMRKGGFTA